MITKVCSYLRLVISHPRHTLQLARRALVILKSGGVRALQQSFLARLAQVQVWADYQRWVQAYDTLTALDHTAIRQQIAGLTYKPLISVVMPTYNTPEQWLRLAIESVRNQLYPHWELCIADDASATSHVRRILEEYREQEARIKVVLREHNGHISAASNSALELSTGDFIAFLDHDDELPVHALYMVALELNAHPEADLIYSDEDKIDAKGQRYAPYFKPDWNPDLFTSQNCVGHLGVYRTALVREVGGLRVGYEGAQDWDLALRISESVPSSHIRHIPHVLYHWRAIRGSAALDINEKGYARDAQARVLEAHFDRLGLHVVRLPVAGEYWRMQYPLPQSLPLVTLIIPARNCLDRLYRCVESIDQQTIYPHFELLIVATQSDNQHLQKYLPRLARERDVRVLHYPDPCNVAAMYNFAVRSARGEVIGLLHSTPTVISSAWLGEMVSHALRPEIGAVGAMLYDAKDAIQQTGMILGRGAYGIAGHAYGGRLRGYAGPGYRALLLQNLSALTVACMVLRRELFATAGGFDATHLPTAFHDVDLCLRLREKGYRNIWTPYAELSGDESARQEYAETPETQTRFQQEIAYMKRRWGLLLLHDPAYNPNLALDRESFALAFPPRATKPWMGEART